MFHGANSRRRKCLRLHWDEVNVAASFSIIQACMQAMGGTLPPVSSPIFASVGDSITQFAQQGISLTGFTITRDAAGLITLAKTNHGIFGDSKVFIANPTDSTYAIMGDGHYVDANTYTVQSTVTGAAGSTTPAANCFVVKMSCLTGRGVIENLQLLLTGGVKFVGGFAQGGMTAANMGPECDLACATNANFILIEAGVNDIRGGATASATATAVISLINKVTTAGKTAVVLSIAPQGSQVPSYGTYNDKAVAANALISAACNGTTSIYINTNTGLTDSGTTSPNLAAWSWSVLAADGIHPHSRAAYYRAQLIVSALSGKITTHDLLPVAATSVPYSGAVANTTIVRDYNLWPGFTTTTSGFFTGATGTRGNNTNASRVVGTPTTTMSVLADPGDGLGAISRLVIQPAAANDRVQFWGITSGESIAAAGLAVGDTFIVACQVYGYSNWDASQASGLYVTALSNSSGTFGSGFGGNDGGTTEATVSGLNVYYGDSSSAPFYLVSGVMKVHSSMTTVSAAVEAQFAGFTAAQPLTLDLRRLTLIKVPLGY